MLYTCKFSVGHKIYPLVDVGCGQLVVGEMVVVEQVSIKHDKAHGVIVQYFCSDEVVRFDESVLFSNPIDAKIATRGNKA